jgi:threonyl-tRNA synthetase
MTQDDAHIYCTREQMAAELANLLDFVLDLLRDFGLTDFYLELSTRDDSDKFIGSMENWAEATAALEQAAAASKLELVPDPGGAAYYGPKISVQARDAIGRSWQMSTIQVDFNQPERFELEYQGDDGQRHQPVMIHRALFGSIERFFGVLTEHYAGAFPAWLAPVQVMGIPIRTENIDYLERVAERLRGEGVRAEVDQSDDRMQKKILHAQHQKVPFMFVAGPRDVEADAVSMRYRNGVERRGVPIDEAIQEVALNISSRLVEPDALNPEHLVNDTE